MSLEDAIANLTKLQKLLVKSALDNTPVPLETFRTDNGALYKALDFAIDALLSAKSYSPGVVLEVVDTQTGEYPNLEKIALNEDWAKNLIYCDMEGFSVNEDGYLQLSDECGNVVYCPPGRFKYTISVVPNLQKGGDAT